MRILGVSYHHDSSVCIIQNGEIEFYCKEERLSGKKRDGSPWLSLQKAKEHAKGNIDAICMTTAANGDPVVRELSNVITKMFPGIPYIDFSESHHLIHASLAFYNSGFDEALVFVVDRNGSLIWFDNKEVARESESVYKMSYPFNVTALHKSYWLINPSHTFDYNTIFSHIKIANNDCDVNIRSGFGITKVYEAATSLIGRHPLDNGKTMGLSAYGEDKRYENLFVGSTPIDMYFQHETNFNYYYPREIESRFSDTDIKREFFITEENFQPYANKAKHVQLETQKAVLHLIKKYTEKTGVKNVCFTGGYGLNVVANSFYKENLPDINFYFEPIADDSGNSIGVSKMKYYIDTQSTEKNPLKNLDFHFYEDDTDIKAFPLVKESSIKEVCDLILNNKSVALFGGNPEAGPRALGNRSIVFNAKNKNAKEIVNKIKKREWFRPFAGVVQKEDFEKYFKTLGLKESKFMVHSFEANENCIEKYPGILHVDNTCRVQTVENGILYDILSELKKHDLDMILNTSFNLAGKPLVQKAKEAISICFENELDAVYFYDHNLLLHVEDCGACKSGV